MEEPIALLLCVCLSTVAAIFWVKTKDPQFVSSNWDEFFLSNWRSVHFLLCLSAVQS